MNENFDGIIIGFSRPKKVFLPILAWIIMLFDRSNYSHVYVKWYSKKHEEWVHYEADTSGVRFVGSKAFKAQRKVIIEYALPPMTDKRRLIKFALRNAGSDYPMWHLIGIALAVIVKKICGKEIRNIFSNDESICSKLTVIVLEIIGYDIRYTDKKLNKATPADVEKLVRGIVSRGKDVQHAL